MGVVPASFDQKDYHTWLYYDTHINTNAIVILIAINLDTQYLWSFMIISLLKA